MFTIILDRFTQYATKEIYGRLAATGQTVFKIILTRMNHYDKGIIGYLMVVEYNEALYCGQLLSGLGKDFAYRVPCKNSHHPFYFIIEPDDIEQLALTLFHLASVYDENDTKRLDYYDTEKNNFYFSCWDSVITPVCSGFLPVIAKLLEEDNLNIVTAPAKLPKSNTVNRIRFVEFFGYTRETLFQYLQLMETRSLCLILDRFDNEVSYDANTIAREFFHAAFVGEQIQAVCKCFSYLVPDLYSTKAFQFDVVTNNLQGLADVLYETIRLKEATKEIYEHYHNKMDVFGESYSEGELDPACHGLLDIFEDAAERAENNG